MTETTSETVSTGTTALASTNSGQDFSTDLLRVYYARLFPYELMVDWLSYGKGEDFFGRREWSFTIEEIYLRYQSFQNKEQFIEAIRKRQPHKIDIGAVFTAPPKDHSSIKPEEFKTVERELVFDVDMTDYDDIRTCCEGANICLKCWPFMTMAMNVVDTALREDFAFKNILWVYSGRRGVHCWVCDPEARQLSNEARASIVDYMSIPFTSSKENSDKKIRHLYEVMHPSLQRAYEILEPLFQEYIASDSGQALLSNKQLAYRKVLNTLPDESVRRDLDAAWEKTNLTGQQKWEQLVKATTAPSDPSIARKKRSNFAELSQWRHELVFQYCYPRLDANVSKTQNHLLKSPFCIHPKTGRVCIPIPREQFQTFNPFEVPTVRSLCNEIDEYDVQGAKNKVDDVDKTTLKESTSYFKEKFLKEMRVWIRAEQERQRDQQQADLLDF